MPGSNNFDGPVLLDNGVGSIANPVDYFGFQRSGMSSTGPRIYAGTGDPNGTVTSPLGSVWLRTDVSATYVNTDGGMTWALFSTGAVTSTPSILTWGNNSIAATTTTRYLSPWWSNSTAPTSAVQFRAPFAMTLRNLRLHTVPAGNGSDVVYTVRINGVATGIAVTLASTGADGSDLVNTAAVAAGDLIDIEVTKAAGIGTSPSDLMASLEGIAA